MFLRQTFQLVDTTIVLEYLFDGATVIQPIERTVRDGIDMQYYLTTHMNFLQATSEYYARKIY